MSIELMMMGVLIVSALTGLAVEGIKKILDEYGKSYHPNMLAGCVALALSVCVGAGYTILVGEVINAQLVVYLIALVFLSWLCSMVGYDKVKQTISQIIGG